MSGTKIKYEDLTPEEKEEGYGRVVARKKRFQKGNNHGSKGFPHYKKVGALRAALFEEASEEDIRQAIRALIEKAHAGNIHAIKELLDRCLGKVEAQDLMERLEQLEEFIKEASQ